jgi:hypothetical protein
MVCLFLRTLAVNRSLSFGASCRVVWVWYFEVLNGELGCVGCRGWVSRVEKVVPILVGGVFAGFTCQLMDHGSDEINSPLTMGILF